MAETSEIQLRRSRTSGDGSFQAKVHFRKSQSGAPKMEGYLKKRVSKLNMKWFWRKYWFVLDGKSLLYFKSKSDYNALGTCRGLIDFGLVQTVRATHEAKNSYGFQIITHSDTIHLSTADRITRDVWVSTLQGAIGIGEVSWPFGVQLSDNAHLKELQEEGISGRPAAQCPKKQKGSDKSRKAAKTKARLEAPTGRGTPNDTRRPSSETAALKEQRKGTLRRIRSFSFGLNKSRFRGFFRQLTLKKSHHEDHGQGQDREEQGRDEVDPPVPPPPPNDIENHDDSRLSDVGYATIGELDYDAPADDAFRVRIPVMESSPIPVQEPRDDEDTQQPTETQISRDHGERIHTDVVTYVTEIYCNEPLPPRRDGLQKRNSSPVYQRVNKPRKPRRRSSLDDVFATKVPSCDGKRSSFDVGRNDLAKLAEQWLHGDTEADCSALGNERCGPVYQEIRDEARMSSTIPSKAVIPVDKMEDCLKISDAGLRPQPSSTQTAESTSSPSSDTTDESTYETATLGNSLEELPETEYFEDYPHVVVTTSRLEWSPRIAEETTGSPKGLRPDDDLGRSHEAFLEEIETLFI